MDNAGRRQYVYHDAWRALRDRQKFERVLEFGRSLPRLRASVERDLGRPGMDRARVLAGAVRLLDLGFFRIGGEEYAQEHETFGIATLRKSHVKLTRGKMVFDYPAKGSVERIVTISDPATYRLLRALKNRRGGEDLFAYKTGSRWVDIRSADVNAYIRDAAGGDFSAKDFRTWSATVLGASELAGQAKAMGGSATARKRAASLVVKRVAGYLGNTPAVCRRSYLDPKVLDRFEGGETIAPDLRKLSEADVSDEARKVVERAVIDLLDDGGPAHLRSVGA
jgi:DNA topoisomerase I